MLKIKLAARRQVKAALTPPQQKLMDEEIESVAKSGKKGGSKKAPPKVDPFENEETLSKAIMNYAALMPAEKTALVLQVKRAAIADSNLGLTAEQKQKISADIAQLSKS